MTRHGSPRKYPRVARVNEVVREALADELERLSDPRLELVTITGVEVSADLRHASVYYSSLAVTGDGAGRGRAGRRRGGEPVPTTDEARAATRTVAEVAEEAEAARSAATHAALQSAAPHLRAELGRQVRMKYVPELAFHPDPAVAAGERMEQLIRELHDADGNES